MTHTECRQWTTRYSDLRITVVGDFCLDRYFDIDPELAEVSLETGLPVHNVTGIRCFAGAAGTIVNNLAALGAARIWPVGISGDDGEGWELRRSLSLLPGVDLSHFATTTEAHTFSYSKPMLHRPGLPPAELSRIDFKNWRPTSSGLQAQLAKEIRWAAAESDAIILLDQVDAAGTGVINPSLLAEIALLLESRSDLVVVGDSRRSLRDWPPIIFKMNARELGLLLGQSVDSIERIKVAALELARRNRRVAFVTLAERGIIGALPDGTVEHVAARAVRGPIDIVGAGDAVTANLTMALAVGAPVRMAMELAMAAANHVIHQLGTTGTATVDDLLHCFE